MSLTCYARPIVYTECNYANGRFDLGTLPPCSPNLSTVRFEAPANFTQGDMIVANGIELSAMTITMANAPTGLFASGAVVQCDLDMDRQLAFFSAGQSEAPAALDYSYTEQAAGFRDEDGQNVYVKSYDFGQLFHGKEMPLDIPAFRRIIKIESVMWNQDSQISNNLAYAGYDDGFYLENGNIKFITTSDRSSFQATVRVWYTCTNR